MGKKSRKKSKRLVMAVVTLALVAEAIAKIDESVEHGVHLIKLVSDLVQGPATKPLNRVIKPTDRPPDR